MAKNLFTVFTLSSYVMITSILIYPALKKYKLKNYGIRPVSAKKYPIFLRIRGGKKGVYEVL
jgi:hypothetical protein